ncbi:MAG: hypothetical protein RL094_477 [Candidatus Parcubacteria bacterium]|jgi:hypothetical protein
MTLLRKGKNTGTSKRSAVPQRTAALADPEPPAKILRALIGCATKPERTKWTEAGLNPDEFTFWFEVTIEGRKGKHIINASDAFSTAAPRLCNRNAAAKLRRYYQKGQEFLVTERGGCWVMSDADLEYAESVATDKHVRRPRNVDGSYSTVSLLYGGRTPAKRGPDEERR